MYHSSRRHDLSHPTQVNTQFVDMGEVTKASSNACKVIYDVRRDASCKTFRQYRISFSPRSLNVANTLELAVMPSDAHIDYVKILELSAISKTITTLSRCTTRICFGAYIE